MINELDFKNKSKFLEFFKLVKLLKSDNPDIMITWLYHSDFIGSLAGKIANVKNILWNIRGTIKPHMGLKEFIYYKLLSYFSFYFPKKIISCSLEGIKQHQKFGYKKNIFHYIPNGISFSHDSISDQISDKLIDKKILKEKFVISMIARYHEQKNHHLLIESFIELEKYFENKIVLLLIGRNIKASLSKHSALKNFTKNNIIFLDEVKNINNFFNFIDLHVLTSTYGEGFPNVILETLSNKIPNIASDVGDAKLIINRSDLIFKNNDKHELKKTLKKLLLRFRIKIKNYINILIKDLHNLLESI